MPTTARYPAQPKPEESEFLASVLHGLSQAQKTLPCRFLYDTRGSELFEEITQLPEYYLTQAEHTILRANAEEIMASAAAGAVLTEFGSGSSRKTEILLDHAPHVSAYLAIDVSPSSLSEAQRRLQRRYPRLAVHPLVEDFTRGASVPRGLRQRSKLGFFPGSTIGNFTPADAIDLLRVMLQTLAPQGVLIVGVDLKKDTEILRRAYNDQRGITAAFNLNLLARINRELGGDFDLRGFRHQAIYNHDEGRIEMHLVSARDQYSRIAERRFRFRSGETIHTENSYKYSIDDFHRVARAAGWEPQRVWTDEMKLFSLHKLTPLKHC